MIIEISDDEEEVAYYLDSEEEDPIMEEDVKVEEEEPAAPASPPASPCASPLPTPTPLPVSPMSTSPPAPSPAPSSPAPPSSEPSKDEGWTKRYYTMEPQLGAYHHTRLVNMLHQYYPEMHAHVKYHNVEYLHPTEISYWKSDVVITKWDYRVGGQRVQTTYGRVTRRADVYASMEDAAEEAYIYYHGKRFEHMEHDPFRYLPREEYEHGPWIMQDPGNADATLEAMVEYAHSQKVANGELKQEMSTLHKAWRRAQEEIEDLRSQLALPPRYRKLYKEGHWYSSP
jgi:hypothetical protein